MMMRTRILQCSPLTSLLLFVLALSLLLPSSSVLQSLATQFYLGDRCSESCQAKALVCNEQGLQDISTSVASCIIALRQIFRDAVIVGAKDGFISINQSGGCLANQGVSQNIVNFKVYSAQYACNGSYLAAPINGWQRVCACSTSSITQITDVPSQLFSRQPSVTLTSISSTSSPVGLPSTLPSKRASIITSSPSLAKSLSPTTSQTSLITNTPTNAVPSQLFSRQPSVALSSTTSQPVGLPSVLPSKTASTVTSSPSLANSLSITLTPTLQTKIITNIPTTFPFIGQNNLTSIFINPTSSLACLDIYYQFNWSAIYGVLLFLFIVSFVSEFHIHLNDSSVAFKISAVLLTIFLALKLAIQFLQSSISYKQTMKSAFNLVVLRSFDNLVQLLLLFAVAHGLDGNYGLLMFLGVLTSLTVLYCFGLFIGSYSLQMTSPCDQGFLLGQGMTGLLILISELLWLYRQQVVTTILPNSVLNYSFIMSYAAWAFLVILYAFPQINTIKQNQLIIDMYLINIANVIIGLLCISVLRRYWSLELVNGTGLEISSIRNNEGVAEISLTMEEEKVAPNLELPSNEGTRGSTAVRPTPATGGGNPFHHEEHVVVSYDQTERQLLAISQCLLPVIDHGPLSKTIGAEEYKVAEQQTEHDRYEPVQANRSYSSSSTASNDHFRSIIKTTGNYSEDCPNCNSSSPSIVKLSNLSTIIHSGQVTTALQPANTEQQTEHDRYEPVQANRSYSSSSTASYENFRSIIKSTGNYSEDRPYYRSSSPNIVKLSNPSATNNNLIRYSSNDDSSSICSTTSSQFENILRVNRRNSSSFNV